MNLTHDNLNDLTNVTFKNLGHKEEPNTETVQIKSAVYKGKKLSASKIKDINENYSYIILEKFYESVTQ